MSKEMTIEESAKYRKGCLTSLLVALAIIILSAGIQHVTSYRTDPDKSAKFLHEFKMQYPKEATEYNIVTHVSNNNFVTVKTNISKTGEGFAKVDKLKKNILEVINEENIKSSGLKIIGKNKEILYDSTTK